MEKIKSIEYRTLLPFYFYIDDVQELVRLLSEAGAAEIEIEACDYKIDKSDELKSLTSDKIHEISITSKKPDILIAMSESDVRINVIDKYSFELQGLVTKIENVFLQKKRRFYPIFSQDWFLYIWLTLVIFLSFRLGYLLMGAILSKDFNACVVEFFFEGFLLSIILPCAVREYYLKMNAFSTIILDFRKDKPGFWKRNKDKLLVGLICSVLGTLLGAGLVTFLSHFLSTRRSPSTLLTNTKEKINTENPPILSDEEKPDNNAPSIPISQNDQIKD